MHDKLVKVVLDLGPVAAAMEAAAQAQAARLELELTPGRLCLAALLVACVSAREAGMTLRSWAAVVQAVRESMLPPSARSQ